MRRMGRRIAHLTETIEARLRAATDRLAAAGHTQPRLDAEVLLRHVLGIDRVGLFLRYGDVIAPADVAAFDALVTRRAEGEPVAYLTGTREFMGLPFIVSPAVLIPRPETELLVEWSLNWLQPRPTATVIDVGTGSGAIGLSLAANAPRSWTGSLVMTDVSAAALAVAARNHAALLTPPRRRQVHLVRGSLLSSCAGPVDLVLANLPYLTPEQLASNPALRAEPSLALAGGADGLDLVRDLVGDLPRVLASGGAAGLELNPAQTDHVADLLRGLFPAASITILRDLAGRPRHVVMQQGGGQ